MRRMLAIVLLLALVAVIPAQAATGKIAVEGSVQTGALSAAKQIHSTTVAPGASFSMHAAAPGADPDGASAVATALYLALRQSGAASFDELSYSSGSGDILVDAGHDFRFTNLAAGTLHIAFKTSGSDLICEISVDEADGAAAEKARAPRKSKNGVSVYLGSDANLLKNVALAAGSIHDVTLAAGDVFSFNAAIGPTVQEFGYLPAADGSGKTIVGGGVNIVASALWMLIQDRSDFVVVAKSTYGKQYNQSYVETSADAILTDYASAADFAFRYTGGGPVTFYTAIEKDVLTIVME